MTNISELLDRYAQGAEHLRAAIAGMTTEQLLARPLPAKWTTHEIVCHLADAELLYADRMKRVLAEERPTLLGLDPDLHVPKLAIPERDVQEELSLIELVRKQMTRILRTLPAESFQRQGIHSEAGPMTLETLLTRVTNHIPHHAEFIAEKRAAFRS
ncbi:MAG: DinB family protein [Planctomycetia bacterium]|nr:DinB family protein [Planctomycetia bacterium]